MNSILEYPFITPFSYASSFVREASPLMKWLLNGRLAENIVVDSSNNTQVVRPTSQNKYLESVTVNRQMPRNYQVSTAITDVTTVSVPGAATAISETPAIATVTVSNSIVTITGVAAGTTTIRVYDVNSTLVGLIVVTVA